MTEGYCEICEQDGLGVTRMNALGRCPVCTYSDHGVPLDEHAERHSVAQRFSATHPGPAGDLARHHIAGDGP